MGLCGELIERCRHRPAATVLPLALIALLGLPAAGASAGNLTVVKQGPGVAENVVRGWQLEFGAREATPRIDCGPTCGPINFAEGLFGARNAELEAFPAEGFLFQSWAGHEGGPAPNCLDGLEANPCRFSGPGFEARTFVAVFVADLAQPSAELRPPAEGGPVDGVETSAATFHGYVDPAGDELAVCRFEYLPEAAYAANPPASRFAGAANAPCVPGPTGIGAGEGLVAVSAAVAGLAANTAYRVRLYVDKGPAVAASSPEPDPGFTTPGLPPAVDRGRAWSVTDRSATLVAGIDANNAPLAECRFEYGIGDSFDHSVDCASAAGSPSDLVIAEASDLPPSAALNFRVVIVNECPVGCGQTVADLAGFDTYATADFPPRGFELVSATDTNGLSVNPWWPSPDGERFAYSSFLPVPGQESGGTDLAFVASRQPDGSWAQEYFGPPPPAEGFIGGAGPTLFSADLSRAFWSVAGTFDGDDANGADDVYVRDAAGTSWISRDPAIPPGAPQTDPADCGGFPPVGPAFVSPDGGRVLFGCQRRLLTEDPSTALSLYEWDRGALRLVSVEPGTETGMAAPASLGSMASGGSSIGERLYGGDVTAGAVSTDESRIVFQAGAGVSSQRLFVRLDAERTVEASASDGITPPVTAPVSVNFWGADDEVESVFFTSGSALTPSSDAPGSVIDQNLGGGSADLYRYTVPADGDPGAGRLIDVTPASIHAGEAGAGVLRVLDVSADGRRVYFVANGALTPDSEPGDCRTTSAERAGECNLYLAEFDGPADESAELRLISRGLVEVAAGDALTSVANRSDRERLREVAASTDGSRLAFRSASALVPGRDTGGFRQVYVFDAERDELSCVSCPPDGTPATGPGGLAPTSIAANGNSVPSGHNGVPHFNGPRTANFSRAGSLFFQAVSPLVDADLNGRNDVYEWRDGQIDLVSTAARYQAFLAGASDDGSTVFVASRNPLADGGQEAVNGIYAARIGGGYRPPTPAPPCAGEGCRAEGGPAPIPPAVGSARFADSGNVERRRAGRRCRNGQVRRGHRCVSRRAIARRACAKRRGKAKRRCLRSQLRRIARAERRQRANQIRRAGR